VNRPSDLKDGTPSYKDYSLCRNNRFQTPEAALKNKPLAPANVLHWFNAPPDADVQGIIDIFVKLGAKPPAKCRIFPKKRKFK
jgi:heterogeneous nuclear ribonucleoprotein L